MNKNNNLKKVCFLIPSLAPGGMERVMSELILNFSKRENVELYVLLFGKKREIFYDLPNNIVIHKPNFEFNNKYRKWYTLKTMRFIRTEVKMISPDTILSFGESWNNLVLLSLLFTKYPIFVSDRCQPDKSLGKIQNMLRRWLYLKAKGIIVQTQKAKEIYKTQFKYNNIIVIGNPIRKIEQRQINRENIVVSVGRLIRSKNFDQLIDIFTKIDCKDWKLIIIGGDALKQHNSIVLQQEIDRLKMNDRIILAGTQKDVESYLLTSKIFAFTSSSEGFPNVIGEAMAAGLPVVSYDCVAGPSDLISDNINGYLIPLFDKDAFRDKLEYLMNNPRIAAEMGIKAQQDIKRFSTSCIGDEFCNAIL